jgi:ribokinase
MTSINSGTAVVCMGSINMDLVMFMDKLPEPGETVITDNYASFPGGKGGNQAATVATLGGKALFLGKLGRDSFSKSLMASLKKKGVNVDHILQTEGTAGVAMVRVDKHGQNSISFTPGANSLLTTEEIYEKQYLFKEGRILLTTFEIDVHLVYEAAKLAKAKGMRVIVDPGPMINNIPGDFHNYVDIIKPNETEASRLTGITVTNPDSAARALKKMMEMGYHCPIITLGQQGLVYYYQGEIQHLGPIRVNSIDSTAAGDVFSGALAVSVAQGAALPDSIKFARAAAGISTTVQGAQTSIPGLASVLAKLREY